MESTVMETGTDEPRMQAARDGLCSLQKWFVVRIEMHYDEHTSIRFPEKTNRPQDSTKTSES
jgi:hypothetical protein